MNLIERAADRLARDASKPPQPPARPVDESTAPDRDESPRAVSARRSRDGVIDLERLRHAGMVPPPEAAVVVSEFRDIARPLLANAFARHDRVRGRANVILITSALRGEGKSFCAINLALGIALETERHVLLVDADVAKPALAASLGLEVDVGLVDRLLDESVDLADALIRTDVPNLSVLAAGTESKYGTDLLCGDPMARLIEDLADRYADRLIIIDGPSVLDTPDLRVLARQVGQVVVVVEADRTPQHSVTRALAELAECATVELLLNKRSAHHSGGGALEPEVTEEE